jgi:molybdopterin synthase catalytic subunit
VRGLENGKAIEGIHYEVHRAMAEHQMNLLAEKAASDFSLTHLLILHRIGFVKVAEASLFLRAASSHRPAAFAASQWLIDELKQSVPIWKRPVFKNKDSEGRKSGLPIEIAQLI